MSFFIKIWIYYKKKSFKEDDDILIEKYGLGQFKASRSDPHGKSPMNLDNHYRHYLKTCPADRRVVAIDL